MVYYAHSKPDVAASEWQQLRDHLINTSDLAFELGRDAGVSELAQVAGWLHDIGKYSQAFQRRLEGSKRWVDHSSAGAQEIFNLFGQNPALKWPATILAYCIAGHHTGLLDYGSVIDVEGDGTLLARLDPEKTKLEDYSAYKTETDPATLTLKSRTIKPITNHPGFSVSFLTRMVFSTLVDADWLETETYMNGGRKPRGEYESIEALTQRFNLFLQRFDNPQNAINQKRTETLKACISKAAEKQGIFTLTVPTGGGKTLASMAFALNHAVEHGLKRIIYVIPFTSIIEQNAAVFKECLGEENILEHHSNFDWEQKRESPDDQTNSAMSKLRLAAENWDIPIVATTNVQFFESLFASKKSRCRKLHNLAKSVIIFDEAQMLPREYMKPCMLAVQELVQNYGASAVFCTATQPLLKQFLPDLLEFVELAPNPQALFDFYKRVQVKNTGKLPDAELLEQMNAQPQVLCIVNTRKHAKGLFDGLAEEGRFHLSTLMCPVHRKQTFLTIRERLKNGDTCRVVSTQVMEAGIDVDFPVGYRALAGLDSVIQAAGRVNREGKMPVGEIFVFEPETNFIKRTPIYIKQTADVARSILRDFSADPLSIRAINAYFETLYNLHDDKRGFDAKEILPCFEKSEGFDFKTAAEKFKLIEDNTVAVIIPYNDIASKWVEELRYTPYPASTLRKLQSYTVNIYENEFQALNEKGVIEMVADNYAVLNDMSYYNARTGIDLPARDGGEAIFFD
jgi:CRISPR-associated endonuclease/helicase Cas3